MKKGLPAAALGWAFFVAAFHSNRFVPSPWDALGAWLLLFVALLAARGIGEFLFARFLDETPFLERHLVFLAGGVAALSLLMFPLGLAGLLKPWAAYLLLAGFTALTYGKTRAFLPEAWGWASRGCGRTLSRKETLLCAAVFLVFAVAVVLSFVPPSFYDTLAFNLGIPMKYALEGGMAARFENYHTFLPQNAELLTTFWLLLSPSHELPHAWNAAAFLLCGLAVFALARRWLSRAWALLAALVFMTTPAVWSLAVIYKNDLAITFVALASLLLILRALDSRSVLLFAASGALAGWCLGAKYSALAFVLSLAAALAARAFFKNERKSALVGAAAFLLAALAVASPWYARNMALTGNPVYPAYGKIFGAPAAGAYDADVQKISGAREAFALPWRLTMDDLRYGHFGIPGFLYLALLPLALWAMRGRGRLGWLLGWSGLMFVLWAAAFLRLRLVLPALAALAVAGVVGAAEAARNSRLARTAAVILLAGGFLSNAWLFAVYQHGLAAPATALLGAPAEREQWFARNVPYHAAAMCANEKLDPARDKIFMVGETRTYYLRIPFESDTAYDGAAIRRYIERTPDASALAALLRSEGFTHLFVNPHEVARLDRQYGYMRFASASHEAAFEEMLRRCAVVCSENGVMVLALP